MGERNMKTIIIAVTILAVMGTAALAVDVQQSIEQAASAVAEMGKAGISTVAVNELLDEAKLAASQGDDTTAGKLALTIIEARNSAIAASQQMDATEKRLLDLEAEGADTSKARASFKLATDAFSREDFIAAAKLMEQTAQQADEASAELARKKALQQAQGVDVAETVRLQWPLFSVGWLGASTVIVLAWRKWEARLLARRIGQLESRKSLLRKLIIEAQKEHFMRGATGREEYELAVSGYRGRMTDAVKELKVARKGMAALQRATKGRKRK
jgi:hypothetical protein